jgi:predicted amidohydrolase YtcJ
MAGVVLAAGSDWTVSSLNPLEAVEVAVTRRDPDVSEGDVLLPEQRLRLSEALAAYTVGGAYLGFAEKERGSIEVGKLADLVVLERNLYEIPPSEISETKVAMTLFGGQIVYRSSP